MRGTGHHRPPIQRPRPASAAAPRSVPNETSAVVTRLRSWSSRIVSKLAVENVV